MNCEVMDRRASAAKNRTSALDMHHQFLRYGWRLRNPAGETVLAGVDFMDLDVDGRIARVVGFFGAQPAAKA